MITKPLYTDVLKAAEKRFGGRSIPDHLAKQLWYFMHDWVRMVNDELVAREDGEETPSEMFERFMKPLRK